MSIRQAIKDTLKQGPMTLRTLSIKTGYPIESIRNARNYLLADEIIRQVPSRLTGRGDLQYELVPVRAVTHHGNVLKSPAWVPPKPTHRPVIDVAPGVVVREYITGRVLCQ